MNKIIFCLVLCLVSGSLAIAQQRVNPKDQADQVKQSVKDKKKNKDPHNLGKLHDGAKKRGIDTSNPDSLKGRDIGGEIAKSIRL